MLESAAPHVGLLLATLALLAAACIAATDVLPLAVPPPLLLLARLLLFSATCAAVGWFGVPPIAALLRLHEAAALQPALVNGTALAVTALGDAATTQPLPPQLAPLLGRALVLAALEAAEHPRSLAALDLAAVVPKLRELLAAVLEELAPAEPPPTPSPT